MNTLRIAPRCRERLDVTGLCDYLSVTQLVMPRFYDFLTDALAEGQPFALGIISGIKGSSPQKKGAKALFFADSRRDTGSRPPRPAHADSHHLRAGAGP